MRTLFRAFCWSVILSVTAGLLAGPGTWAADHDFAVTVVYRVLSADEVNGQLVIEAEGTGQSRLLGSVTAAATVTQSLTGDPCFSYSGDFHLSAAAGTIQIHTGGTVCPPPGQISGAWWVTGGTGAFLGATGFGTEVGKASFTGGDPVIDRLEGTISYPEEGEPLSWEQCLALRDQYVQAYQEAKGCNPMADQIAQCTESVLADLICGCPGYVNYRRARAIKVMEAAKWQFDRAGCVGFFDCTAGICPGAYGAVCMGEGAEGVCWSYGGW